MSLEAGRCPLCGTKAELKYVPAIEIMRAIAELKKRIRVRPVKPHNLEEEVARLRAALEQIASCTSNCEGDIVHIARKALLLEGPRGG